MQIKGKVGADWSSRKITEGWHLFEIAEVKDEVSEKSGTRSLIFRNVVAGDDADEGLTIQQYCPFDTPFGEGRIGDILRNTNMAAAFEKAFPDGTSIWDAKVVKNIINKLPGRSFKAYVDMNKKTEFMEIKMIYPADTDTSSIQIKGLNPVEGAKKPEKTVAKPAPAAAEAETPDWD